jgi:signal peptidase I
MTEHNNFIRYAVHYVTNFIIVISLAWFIVHSFLATESVSGHSMEPAISAGDLVLVDTLAYKFSAPKRMDIIVFQRSDSTENIKRVVGLPGETVVIQNGHIYIDGKLLESDKISDISLAGIAENPVELMADEYFLIGDNADSSEDSRFVNVGNVKKSQIIGKVWFRILPINKFSFIH